MKIKTVKVTSFGPPEVMTVVEAELPEPSEGEVIVHLEASGVNPVDTYMREASRGYKPNLPFTPGIDGAGIVRDTGKGVGRFKEGDAVYLAGSISGTYAEAALCRVDQLYRIPSGLNFRQAAALYVNYFTAFRAIFHRGRLKPEDKVLVHGASGGVGTAALQALAWKGNPAAATAGSEKGLSLLKDLNTAMTANHLDPNHWELIKEWSGSGFDLILEMAAGVNLKKDLRILAAGGRVIVIGSSGDTDIKPRDLMKIDGDIRGMVLANASKSELDKIAEMIEEAEADGFIKPVIRQVFSLEQAPEAHRMVRKPGAAGKIILSAFPAE